MKSLKFEIKTCPKGKILSDFVPNSLELKYFCIKIATKKKFQKVKIPPRKNQRKKSALGQCAKADKENQAKEQDIKKNYFLNSGIGNVFFYAVSNRKKNIHVFITLNYLLLLTLFSSSYRFSSRCKYFASI